MTESLVTGTPVLAVENLTKSYATTPVLNDVTLELRAGEVHAIVGENGAGKSTLINILSGTVKPSSGILKWRGTLVHLASARDSLELGIGVVHQEFTYCPSLSVTENLFLGQQLPLRNLHAIDWRQAHTRAREVLDQLGVRVDVRIPVSGLSPETRKLVEIARALIHHSTVLVFDEPTAALPADASERLFTVIRRLRDRGVAIGYVSHRLDEVMELSDRITVLRDGNLVATRKRANTTVDELVRLMVGRPLSSEYLQRPIPDEVDDGAFEVRDLSADGAFSNVNFSASRGEIVGIGGLDGSGRSELLQALAGDRGCSSGSVWLDGKRIGPNASIHQTIQSGIAYVPPDRQHEGLHLSMSMSRNIALPLLRKFGLGPLTDNRRELRTAREYVERLDIRPNHVRLMCSALSGGNQQKVLLAKWLATKPRVLLLDEPTRGVDVGAKSDIHALMRNLADGGTVIVLASTDMPELLGMAQRVIVLRAGYVSGVFDTRTSSAEDIGLAATASVVASSAVVSES